MKKIIGVLFCVFLLTGCQTKYRMVLDRNNFHEVITVTIPNSELENNEDANTFIDEALSAIVTDVDLDRNYYQKEVKMGRKDTTVTLTYDYLPQDFSNASVLLSCFQNYEVRDTENYYYFSLQGPFQCMYKNRTIDIAIVSNVQLVDHNATEVKGNTYHWKVTPQNAGTVEVMLSVKKPFTETEKKSRTKDIILLGVVITVMGIIIFLLARIRKNERNA